MTKSDVKCAIFFANGFEECEGLITVDMLRRGNVKIDTISMQDTHTVTSSHQIPIQCDTLFQDVNVSDYDVLILPGGKLGTENLEKNEELKQAIVQHAQSGQLLCAICAAPSILGHLGLLENKQYTCFPDFDSDSYHGTYRNELAVTDGNLITGRGMGATIEFARHILMKITDEDTLKNVEKGMQYEHSFKTL